MEDGAIDKLFVSLSSRTPYAWLRERDIDLLVCAELHANGQLTRLLRSRLKLDGASFLWARVSHTDFDGEDDLVVAYETGDTYVVALVENKITANFQPEQAIRYRARCLRWAAKDSISHSASVLLAPADYMTRPGADAFEVQITYEEASDALRADPDPRAIFLADALAAGVAAYRQGYVMTPDENVSVLWQRIWHVASREMPGLNFAQPPVKPKLGTWPWFPNAKGFSKADAKYVELIYKAEKGFVDLQFKSTSQQTLRHRANDILEEGMTIESASKSASIRITVPKIDFGDVPDNQERAISDGLAACERLRVLFEEHTPLLRPSRD